MPVQRPQAEGAAELGQGLAAERVRPEFCVGDDGSELQREEHPGPAHRFEEVGVVGRQDVQTV